MAKSSSFSRMTAMPSWGLTRKLRGYHKRGARQRHQPFWNVLFLLIGPVVLFTLLDLPVLLGWIFGLLLVAAYLAWKFNAFSIKERGERSALGFPAPRWGPIKSIILGLLGVKVEKSRKLAEVRQQWTAACLALGVYYRTTEKESDKTKTKIVPYLHNLKLSPDGDITATAKIGAMMIAPEEIYRHAEKFAACVGANRFKCVKDKHSADVNLTWIFSKNPVDRSLVVQNLPAGPPNRITYGITEDGDLATLDPYKSIFCAGVQGSGKSSLGATVIADLLRRGVPTHLYVVDPKGGQDWSWLQRLELNPGCPIKVMRFETEAGGPALKGKPSWGAYALVEEVLAEVTERQARMGAVDKADFSQELTRQVVPTAEEPLILVLLDELLHLGSLMKHNDSVQSPLVKLISIGRSAAAQVLAFTQLGEKNVIGPVRDVFGQRVCLRTASQAMTDMVLFNGAEAGGAECSKISPDNPGVAYAYDDDNGRFTKIRIAYVSDDVVNRYLQRGLPPKDMPLEQETESEMQDTAVYRIYGRPYQGYDDQNPGRALLRIGITKDPVRRMEEYKRDADWAWMVDWPTVGVPNQSVKWAWHSDRAEALEVEERLIKKLMPIYNEQHGKKNITRRWDPVHWESRSEQINMSPLVSRRKQRKMQETLR